MNRGSSPDFCLVGDRCSKRYILVEMVKKNNREIAYTNETLESHLFEANFYLSLQKSSRQSYERKLVEEKSNLVLLQYISFFTNQPNQISIG